MYLLMFEIELRSYEIPDNNNILELLSNVTDSSPSLGVYPIINFRARRISRDGRKLVRTSTVIKNNNNNILELCSVGS